MRPSGLLLSDHAARSDWHSQARNPISIRIKTCGPFPTAGFARSSSSRPKGISLPARSPIFSPAISGPRRRTGALRRSACRWTTTCSTPRRSYVLIAQYAESIKPARRPSDDRAAGRKRTRADHRDLRTVQRPAGAALQPEVQEPDRVHHPHHLPQHGALDVRRRRQAVHDLSRQPVVGVFQGGGFSAAPNACSIPPALAVEVNSGAGGQQCGWLALRDSDQRGLFTGWEFDGRTKTTVRQDGTKGYLQFTANILNLNHPVESYSEFQAPGSVYRALPRRLGRGGLSHAAFCGSGAGQAAARIEKLSLRFLGLLGISGQDRRTDPAPQRRYRRRARRAVVYRGPGMGASDRRLACRSREVSRTAWAP